MDISYSFISSIQKVNKQGIMDKPHMAKPSLTVHLKKKLRRTSHEGNNIKIIGSRSLKYNA
jgi:hypothetical protein